MILQQNYVKIAEYTQKTFKIYARRNFIYTALKILEKKRSKDDGQKQSNNRLTINQNINSQKSIRASSNQSSHIQQQTFNDLKLKKTTLKNIQLQTTDNLQIQEIVTLNYGDYIYLESYNPHVKQNTNRCYSSLDKIQSCCEDNILEDGINQRRCIFQIINPCTNYYQNPKTISKNSLFALKNISNLKYITSTKTISTTNQFGYEVQLNWNICKGSIFFLQSSQQQNYKLYQTQQMLHIGLQSNRKLYLGLSKDVNNDCQMFCSHIKFKFKFKKVKRKCDYMLSPYFTIKNKHYQLYLSSKQIQNNQIFNKNIYSNYFIEKSLQNRQKGNPITIEQLQINIKYESQIKITQKYQNTTNSLDYIWQLQHNKKSNQTQYNILSIGGLQGITIKNNKVLRLSTNHQDLANWQLHQINKQFQIINNGWKMYVVYDKQKQKYEVVLSSKGRTQIQQKKQKGLFVIQRLNQRQTEIIMQLSQILIILKKYHKFLQSWGYLIDKKINNLIYSSEQVKIKMILMKNKSQKINNILMRLIKCIPNNQFSNKVKNIIKKLKIVNLLVSICKLIILKIQHDQKDIDNGSPYMLSKKILQPLLKNIFKVLQKCIFNNSECSKVITQQTFYFNKIIVTYSQQIGSILKQSIKNLSLFTTKSVTDNTNQLFIWANLITTVGQQTIKIQKIYIDIVTQIVVDPDGRGIIPYQNKYKQLLFLIQSTTKRKCLPKFNLVSNKPIIIFQNNSNRHQFFQNNHKLKNMEVTNSQYLGFEIQRFYQEEENLIEYIHYIGSILRLMRNLCKDRNKKLLKVIEDWGLINTHIFAALWSDKIGWQLKVQYLNLYVVMSIDHQPFLSFKKREIKCHVWQKIPQYNLQEKTAYIFRQYTDKNAMIQKLKQFDQNIIPLIQQYLNLIDYQIQRQIIDKNHIGLFTKIIQVIYESMNYGFLTIQNIQFYTSTLIEKVKKIIQIKSIPKSIIYSLIIKLVNVIELQTMVMINLQGICCLKKFVEDCQQGKNRQNKKQIKLICINMLKNKFTTNMSKFFKNYSPNISKKKITFKQNQQQNKIYNTNLELNEQLQQKINEFLVKSLFIDNIMQQIKCYDEILKVINIRSNKNKQLSLFFDEIVILNNNQQEQIYNNLNGREPGKLLNILKIQQLVQKIKGWEEERVSDNQQQKRKRQKILQLNNLLSKIIRQMEMFQKQSNTLFKKIQQILQKLNAHKILKILLPYSYNPLYQEVITNIYIFYILFINKNPYNTKIISEYFMLLIKNLTFSKLPIILSSIFPLLQNKEMSFQLIYKSLQKKCDFKTIDYLFEIIYKVLNNNLDYKILNRLKNNLLQYLITSNYLQQLLTSQSISNYFVCFLCQSIKDSLLLVQKLRRILKHNQIYLSVQAQKYKNYNNRAIYLKLYYFFFIKDLQIQQKQLIQLVNKIILPELKHLPSICHNMSLQNFKIKGKKTLNSLSFKELVDNNSIKPQYIEQVKQIYQKLVIYESERLQPSLQQDYLNFMLQFQNPNQMSLLNFSILAVNRYPGTHFPSNSIKQFNNYVKQLCRLLSLLFDEQCTEYQRSLLNKVQLLAGCIKQKLGIEQDQVEISHSQQSKSYAKQFFNNLSQILRDENVSHKRLIECMDINDVQLIGKRSGLLKAQKLINELQFQNSLKRLLKYLNNPKKLEKVISGSSLMRIFNIFRQKKIRKLNIYLFVDKLVGMLQYLRIQQINNSKLTNSQLYKQQFEANLQQIYSYIPTEASDQKQLKSYTQEIIDCLSNELIFYSQNQLISNFSSIIQINQHKISQFVQNKQINIFQILIKHKNKNTIHQFVLRILQSYAKLQLLINYQIIQSYIAFVIDSLKVNCLSIQIQIVFKTIKYIKPQQLKIIIQNYLTILVKIIFKEISQGFSLKKIEIFKIFSKYIYQIYQNKIISSLFKSLIKNQSVGALLELIKKKQSFNSLYFEQIFQLLCAFISKINNGEQEIANKILNNSIFSTWIRNILNLALKPNFENTNIQYIIVLKLLNYSLELIIKLYLKDCIKLQNSLFKQLPFNNILQTLQYLYNFDSNSKIQKINHQYFCYHIQQQCTKQFCNYGNTTYYDQIKFQILIKMLIVVQISVSIFDKSTKSLNYQDYKALMLIKHFDQSNQEKYQSLTFYMKFLGHIVIKNQQKKYVDIYFKIPILLNYNNQNITEIIQNQMLQIKEDIMYQYIWPLSTVLERQLESYKTYSKFPFLIMVLNYRNIINGCIILWMFISYSLGIANSFSGKFIILMVFIFFKTIFMVVDYRAYSNLLQNLYTVKAQKQKYFLKWDILQSLIILKIITLATYYVDIFFTDWYLITIFCQISVLSKSREIFGALFYSFKKILPLFLILIWFIVLISGILFWIDTSYSFVKELFEQVSKEVVLISTQALPFFYGYKFPVFFKHPLLGVITKIFIITWEGFFISFIFIFFLQVKKSKKSLKNKCFICFKNFDGGKLQQQSFKKHLKFEHNIWNYFYFFIYFREKQREDHIQIYLKNKIQSNQYDFLIIL